MNFAKRLITASRSDDGIIALLMAAGYSEKDSIIRAKRVAMFFTQALVERVSISLLRANDAELAALHLACLKATKGKSSGFAGVVAFRKKYGIPYSIIGMIEIV